MELNNHIPVQKETELCVEKRVDCSEEDQFKCNICQTSFSGPIFLKFHMSVHSEETTLPP